MSTYAEERGLLEIDTTDVDRWIGQPLGGQQMREPFSTNDIRRFVQGMANANPLYFDSDYAAESVHGRVPAPQSYFGGGPGTGAIPAIQGIIPDSHMLFGGDEFWFFGPRVFPGDQLRVERMLFDYKVANTSFAGPTMFSRGDTVYFNQRGETIARQRSTSIRYLVENARRLGLFENQQAEPEITDEELERIEQEKLEYITAILQLGHGKRLWKDVNVGDQLQKRVIGPHSVQSFTTESRTEVASWGAFYEDGLPSSTMGAGWLPEMSQDQERGKINPQLRDGLVYGPSRGHVQPRYARVIGMPRAYGYGATMGAWITDFLANWGGEHCFVDHVNSQYRNPALSGDWTYQQGEVEDKWIDERGRGIVQIRHVMVTQTGTTMARGLGEIVLPLE